jgi:PAS domain S-box-containing protein
MVRNTVVSLVVAVGAAVTQAWTTSYQPLVLGVFLVTSIGGVAHGTVSLVVLAVVGFSPAREYWLFLATSTIVILVVGKIRAWRNLLESIPQIVWMTDKTGGGMYCSREWENYTGTRLERNWGTPAWAAMIHPDDVSGVVAAWNKAIANNDEVFEARYRLRSKSNEYRWFLGKGKMVNGVWTGYRHPRRNHLPTGCPTS